MKTVVLLIISNVFMTFAWYWHLRFKKTALATVILISWLIAGVEYCFAVPANRIGHNAGMSGGQLKLLQEVITLSVFAVFSVLYLREKLTWNYAAAGVCILGAVFFLFIVRPATTP